MRRGDETGSDVARQSLDTPRRRVILAVKRPGSTTRFQGATGMIQALEIEAREGLRIWRKRCSRDFTPEAEMPEVAKSRQG